MSRPTTMKVDGTVYWTINTYTDAGVLVDADSTPIVDIRKNGSPVLDVASSSKRSGATGVYDYSYDPASESEGDTFTIEETATISSQSYRNTWSFKVFDAERGTDGANTVTPNTIAPVDVSANVALILADTNELQGNQGDWATATGFSTFDHTSDTVTTDTASRDASKADTSLLATEANVNSVGTVTGQTFAAVSLLNDFDPVNDTVANVSNVAVNADMRGTDNALLAANTPTNFGIMIVDATGKITTSNPASGGGSAHTAADVRDLILGGDKTTITMASNKVSNVALVDTTTNLTNGGGGGTAPTEAEMYTYFTSASRQDTFKADVSALALESTVQGISADVAALDILLTTVVVVNQVALGVDIANILADTNELQTNQNNWLTATTTVASNMRGTDGANTVAPDNAGIAAANVAIDALNDFDPASDVVAHVTLVDTTTNLTNGGGGGSCPTAQEIVDAWGNQDQSVYVTQGTLGYYLDAQVSSAGSGGTGLYQATVRVQDNSNNSLQGARINVDGTTLTLTTGSSGEVTFNLDSGVYLLEVSPPAGYDTPVGQVLTISASDPSQTTFTLASTTGPSGCTPPWIG